MSTSTLASPVSRTWTTLRAVLAALIIVALTSVAFAVGRTTVSSHSRAPIVVPSSSFDSSACPVLLHIC